MKGCTLDFADCTFLAQLIELCHLHVAWSKGDERDPQPPTSGIYLFSRLHKLTELHVGGIYLEREDSLGVLELPNLQLLHLDAVPRRRCCTASAMVCRDTLGC